MNGPEKHLTPQLIRDFARLAGLDLPHGRAAELLPALASVLEGDARIAALHLGALSAVGGLLIVRRVMRSIEPGDGENTPAYRIHLDDEDGTVKARSEAQLAAVRPR